MCCSLNKPVPPNIESAVVRVLIHKAWNLKHGCDTTTSRTEQLAELDKALNTARTSGILGDVLREAVRYKVLREVVCGAVRVDSFEEVLVLAKEHGLLTNIVSNCRRFNVELVTVSMRCGMLSDVLGAAVEYGAVVKVLNGALRADVLEEFLVEAKKINLLCRMFKKSEDFLASLVKEIIIRSEDFNIHLFLEKLYIPSLFVQVFLDELVKTKDVFEDVLNIAVESKGMGILLPGVLARGMQVDMDVLKKASALDKLGTLVKVADMSGVTDDLLIGSHNAEPGILDEVLREVGFLKKPQLKRHGDMLMKAHLSGKLRKAVKFLQYDTNMYVFPLGVTLQRWYLLEAAKDQGILDEVLEAERLNELFELFEAFLACVLLMCIISNEKLRRTSPCSSDHRKCVIDHVTLLSGDIERNPGPINDWLKKMYRVAVGVVLGYKKKRIGWKKLGLDDPNNTHGFDKSKLRMLFTETMMQELERKMPDPYREELGVLKNYILTGQEPDMCQLEELEKKRELKVTLQEALKELQSQKSSVQHDITDYLASKHLQFALVNTSDGARSNDEEEIRMAAVESALVEEEDMQQQNVPVDGVSEPAVECGTQADSAAKIQQSGSGDREAALGDHLTLKQDEGPAGQSTLIFCDSLTEDEINSIHPNIILQQNVPTDEPDSSCDSGGHVLDLTPDEEETLMDFLEKEGILDNLEDQEHDPNDDTQKDALELLLDQHTSSTVEDATASVVLPVDGRDHTNTADCPVDLDKTTPRDERELLQEQINFMAWNLKLLTGIRDINKCAYNPEDIGIMSPNTVLCRKRVGCTEIQNNDASHKRAKIQ